MRTVSTTSPAAFSRWKKLLRILTGRSPYLAFPSSRTLAQVRSEPFSELWFTAAVPTNATNNSRDELVDTPFVRSEGSPAGGLPNNGNDHKPPDERTLKLGKTLRTLSPLLPNILTTQLPPEVMSPHISLHLFPSTHPHLPVVRGRIPYRAALLTAPVAWGCVPVVGNVKLEILSEKIVRSGFITAPSELEEQSGNLSEEKLVVRWRTEPKRNGNGSNTTNTIHTDSPTSTSSAIDNGGINRGLSTLLGGDRPLFTTKDASGSDTFTGLFIFSFDSEGRIANHTIEHADEAGGFDKTSPVVTLTDWLLGKARWRAANETMIPGLAYKVRVCRDEGLRKHEYWRRR